MVLKMKGLTKQQIMKHKIDRSRLIKGIAKSMHIHEAIIVISIIMQTRLSKPKTIKFCSVLGFNQINLILKKEQLVVIPLIEVFYAEKIELQRKTFKK